MNFKFSVQVLLRAKDMLIKKQFQKFGLISLAVSIFLVLPSFSSVVWAQSDSLDRIVVTVNGEPITETDVQRRIRLLIFDEVQAGRTAPSATNVRAKAIDRAISQLVKRQEARRFGIFIADAQISARLSELSDRNGVSTEQLMAHFVEQGLTEADVQTSLEEVLIEESLTRRVLSRRVLVREEEIDRYLKVNFSEFESGEQYNLTIIVIPDNNQLTFARRRHFRQVAEEIAFEMNSGRDFRSVAIAVRQIDGIESGDVGWIDVGEIAPEVLQEISKVNPSQHVGPIKSEGSLMFALVNDYREAGRVELPEVREFHLARLVLISSNDAGAEVIAEQMENLRGIIIDGADFSSLAKLYSHDNETRLDGGDLGWVSEDNLPFEYFEPLSTMQPGDISTVQVSGNSVYILQLRAVRTGSYETSKRSVVRERLRNLKLRNESAKWVDQLRSAAAIKYRSNY